MHLHTAYNVALAMVITQNLCHAGRQEAGAMLVLTERLGLPDGDDERRRVTRPLRRGERMHHFISGVQYVNFFLVGGLRLFVMEGWPSVPNREGPQTTTSRGESLVLLAVKKMTQTVRRSR